MKILYIEDNNINRMIFETLLSPRADIACAENGPAGLEMAAKDCYEMIVIDLNLNDPKMDGFDVLKSLRENGYCQKCSSSKLFALTSYAGDEWEKKCIEAGFDGYFNKPLDPNIILENYNGN
ncbi:response regulator [Litoribacter ruber]|uniref:Response regulator n=1 Tax=Litoribacter ruber TaxID=702568 RepID=A0AAP2CF56_9BACT|nr:MULTISPECIES: response regulator [Litoribacter]MBS9523383.1 response regulator [Litoribacter alkaliphilus]MBT0812491.1 response regulator [Litoribacter ruber]